MMQIRLVKILQSYQGHCRYSNGRIPQQMPLIHFGRYAASSQSSVLIRAEGQQFPITMIMLPFKANGSKHGSNKIFQLNEQMTVKYNEGKKVLVEILMDIVNTHHRAMIKSIDQVSAESITILREKWESGEFGRLVDLRNETKRTQTLISSIICKSAEDCHKDIEDFTRKSDKNSKEQIVKPRLEIEKHTVHNLRQYSHEIRAEIYKFLAEQRVIIESKLKKYGDAYIERAKFNQNEDKPWFEDGFLDNVYAKDWQNFKKFAESTAGELCFQLNESIRMADAKIEKKRILRL